MAKKETREQQEIVGRVMHEFKHGELRSGNAGKIRSPRQAIAIALSEAGVSNQHSPPENNAPCNRRSTRKTGRRRPSARRGRADACRDSTNRPSGQACPAAPRWARPSWNAPWRRGPLTRSRLRAGLCAAASAIALAAASPAAAADLLLICRLRQVGRRHCHRIPPPARHRRTSQDRADRRRHRQRLQKPAVGRHAGPRPTARRSSSTMSMPSRSAKASSSCTAARIASTPASSWCAAAASSVLPKLGAGPSITLMARKPQLRPDRLRHGQHDPPRAWPRARRATARAGPAASRASRNAWPSAMPGRKTLRARAAPICIVCEAVRRP